MIKLLIGIYLAVGMIYLILVIINEFDAIKGLFAAATKLWQKMSIIAVGFIVFLIPGIILGPILLTIYIILVIIDQTIQLIRGV